MFERHEMELFDFIFTIEWLGHHVRRQFHLVKILHLMLVSRSAILSLGHWYDKVTQGLMLVRLYSVGKSASSAVLRTIHSQLGSRMSADCHLSVVQHAGRGFLVLERRRTQQVVPFWVFT